MGTVATVTIATIDFDVYALTADPNLDATNYFIGSLSSSATAWAAATTDNQNKALVQATRWIASARSSRGAGGKGRTPVTMR